MDILSEGRRVFDTEIAALEKTKASLDETFVKIVELVTKCSGKVIVTGMGKPGHIAAKIAATFASLGSPAFHLHPAEALHGDLGMISENDVVIAISYSGESDEIIRILPNIKMIGAVLVGITGNPKSALAQASDYVQILPAFKEACYLGLAPTSSTTAALCYGDAVAVVASGIYGFDNADFGKFHPAGSLGKKLILKVSDLMYSGEKNSVIPEDTMLRDAIVELSKKGLGVVSVIGESGELCGIITDGDLRRLLEKRADIYGLHVRNVMTVTPKIISSNKFAAEALKIMNDKNVSCLPVVDSGKVVGLITLQSIVSAGIV